MTNDEEENLRKALNAGSAIEQYSFQGQNTAASIIVKMDSRWGTEIQVDADWIELYPEDIKRIWKEAKRFYNLPEP